jgi:DNA-binding XRE family transcriptional regulator
VADHGAFVRVDSAFLEVSPAAHEEGGVSPKLRGAKGAKKMTRSGNRPVPVLLGDARRALHLNQEQLANAIGSSKRTVQRWETARATPFATDLTRVAALVYPHDASIAADIAAAMGQTLEGLGIVAPPAPPPPPPPAPPAGPPPMPRHLAVDAVVCVASESLGAVPTAVRAVLLAAFRRARELGLSCDEVEQALDAALRPATPAATPPHAQ